MEPEALAQIADVVSGAVEPLAARVGELAASGAAGASLDASQFDEAMTLGTSLLMSNVVLAALAALACGILLGILLTQHWRP